MKARHKSNLKDFLALSALLSDIFSIHFPCLLDLTAMKRDDEIYQVETVFDRSMTFMRDVAEGTSSILVFRKVVLSVGLC